MGFAEAENLEVFVLGGGSNILVSDTGFDGLVIHIGLKGITVSREDGVTTLVTAGAGEDWDDFVDYCVKNDLAGLECLSGIPGLVGGTPIQNVGAYGQEVCESIVSVEVFDRIDNERKIIPNEECGFDYRKSIFNTTEKGRYIVLSVTYSLTRGGAPKIVYRELIEMFGSKEPTLHDTREAVCEIRKSKGMLVRQGGYDAQSAGSFFKNPVISGDAFRSIERVSKENGFGEVPKFAIDKKSVKVPAAWLIEKTGFVKGFTKGRAGLSTKHALALTNRGGATAAEIVELKEIIRRSVNEKFGVELVPEPNLIGF